MDFWLVKNVTFFENNVLDSFIRKNNSNDYTYSIYLRFVL